MILVNKTTGQKFEVLAGTRYPKSLYYEEGKAPKPVKIEEKPVEAEPHDGFVQVKEQKAEESPADLGTYSTNAETPKKPAKKTKKSTKKTKKSKKSTNKE